MREAEAIDRAHLEREAEAARAGIVNGVRALAAQLEPRSLIERGAERAIGVLRREARLALDDAGRWVRANAGLIAAFATVLGALAALGHTVTRRRLVPLERAYSMEDPTMHETESEAPRAWDRVREGAEELGNRAGETYYHARSKAAQLGATARERALEAADAAGDVAARAADWTKRQPQEHPMTSVIIGFAFGAILAALLPRGGRLRA
ncbi:hypothetical protein [Thermaurantiacus sp.]